MKEPIRNVIKGIGLEVNADKTKFVVMSGY